MSCVKTTFLYFDQFCGGVSATRRNKICMDGEHGFCCTFTLGASATIKHKPEKNPYIISPVSFGHFLCSSIQHLEILVFCWLIGKYETSNHSSGFDGLFRDINGDWPRMQTTRVPRDFDVSPILFRRQVNFQFEPRIALFLMNV